MVRKSIILSIKPEYAHKIFSGQKTIELRRQIPKHLTDGDLVIVYSTSPDKMIIGFFTVKEVIKITPTNVSEDILTDSCISRIEFQRYFDSANYGYAIKIDQCWTLPVKIELQDLKKKDNNFNVPQNFRYVTNSDYTLFEVYNSISEFSL